MAHDFTVLSVVDAVHLHRRGLRGTRKFGRNPSFDAADGQVEVWTGPTLAYNWLGAASTLYISSSAVGDTEPVIVQGLNANWELQQAAVTLAGQSFVEVPTSSWMRVFRIVHDGSIELTGNVYLGSTNVGAAGVPTDLATVVAFIQAGQQVTQQTPFTIPVDHEGYVTSARYSLNIAAGGNRVVNFVTELRDFGKVFREVFRADLSTAGTSFASDDQMFPEPIPEKTDISVLANTDVNDTDVAVNYTIVLRRLV